MKNNSKIKMFVLAFCITGIYCVAQQSKINVCRLGEIKNDSIAPYIDSLEINCAANEITKFKLLSPKLTSLSSVILSGDATAQDWSILFDELKIKPKVKNVLFTGNTFGILPYGYENLFNVEKLSICNNDEMDLIASFEQFGKLPNLRELTLDIYTVFEMPDSIEKLKSIVKINLINKSEAMPDNVNTADAAPRHPLTYDFYMSKGGDNYVVIKYTAMSGAMDDEEYKELSKRFKTTQNFLTDSDVATAENYVPVYANVKPPIKGIDVKRTSYSVNTSLDNVLIYPSGTRISIPANAFVDKDGKAVAGTVSIKYREFRDPVDIMVSGIPMKYDSAGQRSDFESAGMFELTANVNNEAVKLAPDKKIKMNFNTVNADTTYNFYVYNDSTGNWQYKNKPQTVKETTRIGLKIYSDAYNMYRNQLNSRPSLPDSTKFNDRFLSKDYVRTIRIDSSYQKERKNYFKKRDYQFERYSSKVRIVGVRKVKRGKVLFKIKATDDNNPELYVFTNYYFETDENISSKQFRKKYSTPLGYSDVRINRDGKELEIVLKDYKSFKTINADLVSVSDDGKVTKVKNTAALTKRYDKRLAYRERIFNKSMRKGWNYKEGRIPITDTAELKLYAYNKAKERMSDVEKKMTYNEWQTYYAQVTANEKVILNNSDIVSGNLIKSLSLDGMGIYNCDQIRRIKEPVTIFASYSDEKKKIENPRSAYIIDKKINGVLCYSANEISFSKSKNAQNILLEIDNDGGIGIYKTEDFKFHAFKNKENYEFTLQKINSNFTTLGELKKMIGL